MIKSNNNCYQKIIKGILMIEEKTSHFWRIRLREEKVVIKEWEAKVAHIVFDGKTFFYSALDIVDSNLIRRVSLTLLNKYLLPFRRLKVFFVLPFSQKPLLDIIRYWVLNYLL